jgi:predicted nuclease of predicted toxin-antitoxin system
MGFMTRLYADEQFPRVISDHLRDMEHDVLTVQQAGNAGDSDPEVLAFAIAGDRAVVTQNRRDFIKLHRQNSDHAGIIVCTTDQNGKGLADRINTAIQNESPLDGKLVRVVRPG